MKIAAIAVRNKRIRYDGNEYEPVLSALTDTGYPADKVYILSDADTHEFLQTVIECKNFFDNVVVLAERDFLAGLRAKALELLKTEPSAEIYLETDKNLFFFVPFGKEGCAAVKSSCVPLLEKRSGEKFASAVFRAVGVPRATLTEITEQVRAAGQGKLIVNVSEQFGDLRLEILYNDNAPKMLVDEVSRMIADGLKDYIYAIDDTPLNRRVYELLKLRGSRLSIAESFTGGGVAKRLIEVPGVSEVLFESVVAYSNESKIGRLGVLRDTIEKQGAVSDETAYEMAAGLLATGKCNVAVATTGIAGPGSDGTDKPVGLCYIAAGTSEAIYVYKYIFKGGREEISERAINQALYLLAKQIR